MIGLKSKHAGFLLTGITLSIVFLWLALSQVDLKAMRSAFVLVQGSLLFGSALALAAGVFLRSMRWRTIEGRPWDDQHSFFRATTLGAFSNLVFPVRAGEFVRVITLSKLVGVTLPGPMASALIDRLIDVIVLLLSAGFVCWATPVGMVLGTWVKSLAIATGALAVVIVVIGLYAKNSLTVKKRVSLVMNRWLQRWPVRPELFFAELVSELHRLLQLRRGVQLTGLVIIIFCVDYAAMALLIQASNLNLPPEAPLVLWVFLAAGSALPSAPGYVGIYQIAAVGALSFFGVSASDSVAIATILQITTLLTMFLMVGPSALSACRQAILVSR